LREIFEAVILGIWELVFSCAGQLAIIAKLAFATTFEGANA
jgi:hypothetical protein